MYFKILLIKDMPIQDVSVAITTKLESFEKRMVLNAGDKKMDKDSDFFVYYVSSPVNDVSDAKLLIYTERDDVMDAGDKWICQAVDSLKMLCEMNEYPCIMYVSPMENTAIRAAIRTIYQYFPDEMVAVGDAFGLSDAECQEIEKSISGTKDAEVASIPEDTKFTINNQVFIDSEEPDSYGVTQTNGGSESVEMTGTEDVSSIGGIDLDELANKIAARINNKAILTSSETVPEHNVINESNILKTASESIHEWAIRVFLSDPTVDKDIKETHAKILALLDKSLTYVCKATESTVIKSERALVEDVPTKEEEKVEEKESKKDEESVKDTKEEKSIYIDKTEAEDVDEEDATESIDESDTIMIQVASESSNDIDFFKLIKKYKNDLSHEALDNIAKYNMYEKITSGVSIENSFVTYTKRKTALGI
jgi:hypothetical protein